MKWLWEGVGGALPSLLSVSTPNLRSAGLRKQRDVGVITLTQLLILNLYPR